MCFSTKSIGSRHELIANSIQTAGIMHRRRRCVLGLSKIMGIVGFYLSDVILTIQLTASQHLNGSKQLHIYRMLKLKLF